MSVKPTNFHEYDPDTDYVETPPSGGINLPVIPDAVNCCQCRDGDQNICGSETSSGAFLSMVSAQAFAYWYA